MLLPNLRDGREGPVPLDDRLEREPARQRAERASARALEPRGTERLRGRGLAVTQEQRSLERECEPLDEVARAALVDLRQLSLDLTERTLEAQVVGQQDLRRERL